MTRRTARFVAASAIALRALPAGAEEAAPGIDLAGWRPALVYEANFDEALNLALENDLLDAAGNRLPVPEGTDWVLEGAGQARTDGGRLVLSNRQPAGDQTVHVVFWNTRIFPENLLIEFAVTPENAGLGLNIVFFATTGRDGGGIFDAGQPRRNGIFTKYHSGELNGYHTSYWATSPDGRARETANLRKNFGFNLVAEGPERMAGVPGSHVVRIAKAGPRIQLEVDGARCIDWTDDGKTHGPVLGAGNIGLRQMRYSSECAYDYFRVYELRPVN